MSFPRLGPSAATALPAREINNAAPRTKTLRVDIFDSSLAIDCPAHDRIEVVIREGRDHRWGVELPPGSDKFSTRGLLIAKLIGRPTLQNHRPAIPTPGHA